MHIVSRPLPVFPVQRSMLALTVDRLVGSGHSHHARLSSPDSSDSGSGRSSTPPISPPNNFSKITLLLSNNKGSSGSPNSNVVMISCDERESSGPSPLVNEEGPRVKLEVERELHSRLCPSVQEDSEEDERLSISSRSPHLHCCDRSEHNASPGRPPSSLTQAQHHNSLKFSIHDILRPDFGQRALKRPHGYDNSLELQPRSRPHQPRLSHSRSRNSSGVTEPRPSSVKNQSEDSNSSCTSRTTAREEVVDESKVNPAVPKGPLLWPAWVYCTRYSDRPSSGPRSRRIVREKTERRVAPTQHEQPDEKRPRTAFTAEQLGKLKREFDENRYLTEKRRQDLARDLKLHENQIKIWFQNKRAKLKKSSGQRGGLALQLMAQGLYNHSTVGIDEEDDYLPC